MAELRIVGECNGVAQSVLHGKRVACNVVLDGSGGTIGIDNAGHVAIGVVAHLADMAKSILYLGNLAALVEPHMGSAANSIGSNDFIDSDIAVGDCFRAIVKTFLDKEPARIIFEVLNRTISKRNAADTILRSARFGDIAVLCRTIRCRDLSQMQIVSVIVVADNAPGLIGLPNQTTGIVVVKAQRVAIVRHNFRQMTAIVNGLNCMTVAVKNLLKITLDVEGNMAAILLMELKSTSCFSEGRSALTDQFIGAIRLMFKALPCTSDIDNHTAIRLSGCGDIPCKGVAVSQHAKRVRSQQCSAISCFQIIKTEEFCKVIGAAFELIEIGGILRQIVLVVGAGRAKLCYKICLDCFPGGRTDVFGLAGIQNGVPVDQLTRFQAGNTKIDGTSTRKGWFKKQLEASFGARRKNTGRPFAVDTKQLQAGATKGCISRKLKQSIA